MPGWLKISWTLPSQCMFEWYMSVFKKKKTENFGGWWQNWTASDIMRTKRVQMSLEISSSSKDDVSFAGSSRPFSSIQGRAEVGQGWFWTGLCWQKDLWWNRAHWTWCLWGLSLLFFLFFKKCAIIISYDGNNTWLLSLQVALKFEHRNSKGCNYGPPYEWQVYR